MINWPSILCFDSPNMKECGFFSIYSNPAVGGVGGSEMWEGAGDPESSFCGQSPHRQHPQEHVRGRLWRRTRRPPESALPCEEAHEAKFKGNAGELMELS